MPSSHFEIREHSADGAINLTLLGELDLWSVPELEQQLTLLQSLGRVVRLDLSKLEFIDSTGISLLLRKAHAARTDGWQLEVGSELSPRVDRVLRIINVKDIIVGSHGSEDPS